MATMRELAEARAELGRLEKQEQQLVEQLHHARTSIRQQHKKIGELVRQLPSPVDRLPNEVLLWIFELCLQYPYDCYPQRRVLACVSRRWMDIIMNSPGFWTSIKLASTWSTSTVMRHVTNSRQSPLEIEVSSWGYGRNGNDEEKMLAMLNVLLPCAHRWISLVIERDVRISFLHTLVKSMAQSAFPSLTHISIENVSPRIYEHLSQFSFGNYPQLKHLELVGGLDTFSNFQVPPSVTSLSLDLRITERSSSFRQLALQKLTILVLSGLVGFGQLDPDSIHLPLLEKFVCKILGGDVLMRSIVAPRLTTLQYLPPFSDKMEGAMLDTSTPKYPSVASLVFGRVTFVDCAKTLPFAFPVVRNIVMDSKGAVSLFSPMSSWLGAIHFPLLETLTVHELGNDCVDALEGLAAWLKLRRSMGQPKLPIKFSFLLGSYRPRLMIALHDVFHEHCFLEWENVTLGNVTFTGTIDESLWLVRAFQPVLIEIGVLLHRTGCQRNPDTMKKWA